MKSSKQIKKISFKRLNRNLIIVLIISLVGYFAIQIVVTSLIGTKSDTLDTIRAQTEQLRRQNEILSSQIDQAKSLASAQGFATQKRLNAKNVDFLIKPDTNNLALAK